MLKAAYKMLFSKIFPSVISSAMLGINLKKEVDILAYLWVKIAHLHFLEWIVLLAII